MKNFKRRFEDDLQMDQMTERELLVQHGTVLKKLCGDITDLKKTNGKEHGKLFDKIDAVSEGKISNRLFFWVIGFVFISILALTSFVGSLNTKVVENSTCITNFHVKQDKLINTYGIGQ